MVRTILTTVGTSLLTNFSRQHGDVGADTEERILRFLRESSPEQASAETNSLSRLLKDGDRIVFLHSETDEGKLCAAALDKYFTSQGHSCEVREIPALSYHQSRFKMRGLRSLVAMMIDMIRKEADQGFEVMINATGGFKAEIAYATLVGLLFDVPVYYIHEAFREIIEMPPSPIAWDYSLLADYEEFFEWLNTDLRLTKDVDARLKVLPDEVKLLLSEEDGYTMLSPAGEVFYEAYLAHLEKFKDVALFLSDRACKTYTSADANVKSIYARSLLKVRSPVLRGNGSAQVSNCDCMVYPKGDKNERIFYFEDTRGAIYVCELSRHSDQSYNRFISRGVKRKDYNHFIPFHEV